MTAALKTKLSAEEYLQWERVQPTKNEYFRGQIYAMAGVSLPHNTIVRNLIARLHQALAGGSCRVFPSDLRVKCPTGLYTYPDASIVCGEIELEDRHQDTLLNPRVLIEVLSPSKERYNRGDKFDHYSTIPTLREYVLIAADAADIDHYVRGEVDQPWQHTPLRSITDQLQLTSVGCLLALSAIYEDVTLSPTAFPLSPRTRPSGEPENGSESGIRTT